LRTPGIVFATRQVTRKTTKIETQAVWLEWEEAMVVQRPINKRKKEVQIRDSGGNFLLEEAEPLFHGSNLMEEEEKELLFVLEPTVEERADTGHFRFPNGNDTCDTDAMADMA
jgi:hypothetical protein